LKGLSGNRHTNAVATDETNPRTYDRSGLDYDNADLRTHRITEVGLGVLARSAQAGGCGPLVRNRQPLRA